ncbi:MAG: cytochrome c-type biogenesis protein [Eubacteriales bacterium]
MVKKFLKIPLAIILGAALILSAVPVWAGQVDMKVQKEIEDSLVCQDNCGMILSSCENQTAEYMRKIIVDRLSRGQSKEQVMGYFVSIYGDKVLAAPPAKGFNITAWVTPFIVILAGGLLIYFVLDKWVLYAKLEKMDRESEEPKKHADLSEYEDRLEDELKKYL